MPLTQTRQSARSAFSTETRLTLLESDLDEFDVDMTSLTNELKAIKTILMGILISLTTGSILFTVNIVIGTLQRH